MIFNHSTHTVGTLQAQRPLAVVLWPGGAGGRREDRRAGLFSGRGLGLDPQWRPLDGRHDRRADAATSPKESSRPSRARCRAIAAIKRPFRYKVRTFDEATEDKKVTDYMTAHSPGRARFRQPKSFAKPAATLKPHQGEERETFVQVILIGDVALVGVPAEFFTVLGMEIKQRSPFPIPTSPSWPTIGSAICPTARPSSWADIKPGSARTIGPKSAPASRWSTRPSLSSNELAEMKRQPNGTNEPIQHEPARCVATSSG